MKIFYICPRRIDASLFHFYHHSITTVHNLALEHSFHNSTMNITIKMPNNTITMNSTPELLHALDSIPHGILMTGIGLVEFAFSFAPLCLLAFVVVWILYSGLAAYAENHKSSRLPDSEMVGTTWGLLSFFHSVTSTVLLVTELWTGNTPTPMIVWWSFGINTTVFGGLAIAAVVVYRTLTVYASRIRGVGWRPRHPPTYEALATEDSDDLEAGVQLVSVTGSRKKD